MILENFKLPHNENYKGANIKIYDGNIVSNSRDHFQTEEDRFDCKKYYVTPGLIDLQTYGACGITFVDEPTLLSLRKISNHQLLHGTTGFLITLPCTSLDNLFHAIDIVKKGMEEKIPGLLGLHLEGPFLNKKKKGAHNENFILDPSEDILKKIINDGKDVVKMITIAPEIFPEELLKLLISSGILISAGHSNASFQEAQQFFKNGITCSTHLYNAMSQLESRSAGLTGAILDNDNIWSTIVVDGKHVCYETLKITFRLKKEKLILISDSTFLDAKDEDVFIGGVSVKRRGKEYYLREGGALAGSSISLLDAVKNSVQFLKIPLSDAIEMATKKPAELINEKAGILNEGSKANLILLNEQLDLKGVIYEGKWLWELL